MQSEAIRSFSSDPRILEFAENFCQSEHKKEYDVCQYLSRVLYECVSHEKPEILLTHIAMQQVCNNDYFLLAHLVYQPKSLIQSCFVRCASWVLALALVLSVHTSPWHRVDIETSYLVHKCTYVPYMHIKYLVILTCSFLNGSHFGTFL